MLHCNMDGECVADSKLVCFSRKRASINKENCQRSIELCDFPINTNKFILQCGLERNYEVFSDDDVEKNTSKECKQVNKSQKVNDNPTEQPKSDGVCAENAKIQSKMKSLVKNLIKKDKTIDDLNSKNSHLKVQLQESVKNAADHNASLIELANANNRLQKEIERKNLEISELKLKMSKNELVNSNLLKDIDYYKTELNAAKTLSFPEVEHSEKEFEKLQKKFYEIKIENGKLCRKFKEIRSADDEYYSKYLSYHVLIKKYETVQQDVIKLKMENKKLKEVIRKSKQMFDEETSARIACITQRMNEEMEKLMKIKTKTEEENEKFKTMLEQLQVEHCTSKSLLIDLQRELEKKVGHCRQQEDEIQSLKTTCTQLESKIQALSTEKDEVMRQHFINEENINILKLKLDELTKQKIELMMNQCSCSGTTEEPCENCFLLKQEIEKLGYANLRLNKEKHNLQSNFQKLSIKTSKLTLKMEELELEKQLLQGDGKKKLGNDEHLLEQNVLLSKRLHNLLKKSEKLFKVHVVQQQAKSDKDHVTPLNSNDQIIDELNANLSYSKSNLETIESKLNEEEWKLNAALKHIRSVKEQIQKEI